MTQLRFKQLGRLYLLALGCIALAIMLSQLFIQISINDQQDDARVINVAGRQRMLSQKITKVVLKISQQKDADTANKAELKEALTLWKKSHEGLLNGDDSLGLEGTNSKTIVQMYGEIEPHFQAIYQSASNILQTQTSQNIDPWVEVIAANEASFLNGMNAIVFQYDLEASEKVVSLRQTELILFVGALLIILFELLFVFRPLAKNIQHTVLDLQDSETTAKKMTRELSKLYDELGKSYQELEAVNITPASHTLYARLDKNGQFMHVSDKLRAVMEYKADEPLSSLKTLLKKYGYPQDFINGLFDLFKENKNWSGELKLISESGDFVWLDTFIIPTHSEDELKWIARDVTQFKEARIRSQEINKERIEASIKEQQYRSSLILEGQEEERKRLSKELHDSIGQMLSALKLQQESLIPSSRHMKIKLESIRDLTKTVIQEVRRVSFNLAPSSLEDFGLVAALHKFCADINKLTDLEISLADETKFITRLEPKIEINLYRIVQEAVNNAIKYSEGTEVSVSLSHTTHLLSITIKDDGRGFDYSELESTGYFATPGHGIFNMKERTSYIGGTFELITAKAKGTNIQITIPITKR